MKREIGILYELKDNVDGTLKKLKHCKPVYIKRKIIDTYYYNPLRDTFKPSNIGRLRVREKGYQTLMTHKVDYFDGDTWLYSDESICIGVVYITNLIAGSFDRQCLFRL